MNDNFANCELSTSELDTIAAGIVITHGPNPPQGGSHGGCHHGGYQPPHMEPPRYYPGGSPNSPGLHVHY